MASGSHESSSHQQVVEPTGILGEDELPVSPSIKSDSTKGRQAAEPEEEPYKTELVWRMVVLLTTLHVLAAYGFHVVRARFSPGLLVLVLTLGNLSGLGVTAGAHRLWTHRAYRAKLPLRLFLVVLQTLACQASVIFWARDHRVHHKFEGTVADPYNAKRGFFFSHMGWLMCKKHPAVLRSSKQLDFSDLYADPVLYYQDKYYLPIFFVIWFALPVLGTCYVWNLTVFEATCVSVALRTVLSHHLTWLVNSAAHIYGNKPYDRHLTSNELGPVSFFALGEGWHNYHHAFPWDYKASELGMPFNVTTSFINAMAFVGQAYDLKSVSRDVVLSRIRRAGDGSHEIVSGRAAGSAAGSEDSGPADKRPSITRVKHLLSSISG